MKLKRFFCLLLCLALALGAAACGDPQPAPSPTPQGGESEATLVQQEWPEQKLFAVRVNNAPYNVEQAAFPEDRTQPGIAKDSVGAMVAQDGDFIRLAFAGDAQAWIHSWYLTALDEEEQARREQERLAACTSRESFVPVEEFLSGADHGYVCTAGSGLNCRLSPSQDSPALCAVGYGEQVEVLGRDGDFFLCRLSDGGLAYCSVGYMSSEKNYVELPGAVDLRVYLPSLQFEMLFASPYNITGEAMYAPIPLLESSTARLLARALDIFQSSGYTIKIYDAYRPKSAQYKLYDIVQNNWYIANPYTGNSWHQLGRAVDISLVDLSTGEELEMPTPMHTFAEDACRFSSATWSEEARQNVDYMTEVMTSVGFGTISTEWWHFEYTETGDFMDPDLDYSSLTYRPFSELQQP